jgi:hypothetical protein
MRALFVEMSVRLSYTKSWVAAYPTSVLLLVSMEVNTILASLLLPERTTISNF